MNSAGQLYLTASHALSRSASGLFGTVNRFEAFNRLEFVNADGVMRLLYFGIEDQAMKTSFELPPLPPAGIFDVRFSSQRFAETYGNEINKSLQFPITISSAIAPVTVRWSIVQSPVNMLKLQLRTNGNPYREIQLKGEGSAILANADQSQLVLKIQGKNELPTEFMLYPNHPNPFNPMTMIQYDVPAQSYVVLTVYNLLGQEVTRLVDGIEDAGEKSVEWNAFNVPSGIYFYKINAVQSDDPHRTFSQVRKMVLMK
jgi:hypothetical protein